MAKKNKAHIPQGAVNDVGVLFREDFKKKSVKRMTLCKNDILIGGEGSKPMSLFQDVSKINVILWKRINFQQIKD